jgi:hypothetical protein
VSDKPVAERLQVKAGRRLAVLGASPVLDRSIGAAAVREQLCNAEVVLVAASDRASLETQLPKVLTGTLKTAILWVAYPMLSSKFVADFVIRLDRNVDFARSLGADVVIDYKTQRFEDHARDLEMVFDLIDARRATRSRPTAPISRRSPSWRRPER